MRKTPYRGLLLGYLAIPGLLATVAAVNFLTDPYAIHNPRNTPNKALAKQGKDRLYKAHQVNALKPQSVILGSSRALALSADHPGWSAKPVYNHRASGFGHHRIADFYRSHQGGYPGAPHGWSAVWTSGYRAPRPAPFRPYRRTIGENGDLFLAVPFLAPVGPISGAFFGY